MTINEMLSAIPVWPKMTTINALMKKVLCEGTEKRKDMKKYMTENMFPA